MRQIIMERNDKIALSDVKVSTPIFAKKNGKFIGMIVKEERGWILRVGGSIGATGHHNTIKECITSCLEFGHTFFVE